MPTEVTCPFCGASVLSISEDEATAPPKLIEKKPSLWPLRLHLSKPFMDNPVFVYSSSHLVITASDESGREFSPVSMAAYRDMVSGHFEKGFVHGDKFLNTVILRLRNMREFTWMEAYFNQSYSVALWSADHPSGLVRMVWYSDLRVVGSDIDTLTVVLKGNIYESDDEIQKTANLPTLKVDGNVQPYKVISTAKEDIILVDDKTGMEYPLTSTWTQQTLTFPEAELGESVASLFMRSLSDAKRSFDIVVKFYLDQDYAKVAFHDGVRSKSVYTRPERLYTLKIMDRPLPGKKTDVIEEFLGCEVVDCDSTGQILLRSKKRRPM